MAQFQKGEILKAKIPNSIYDGMICTVHEYDVNGRVVVVAKIDGQMYSFLEMDLERMPKTEFKVGDTVYVAGKSGEWKIVAFAPVPDYAMIRSPLDNQSLIVPVDSFYSICDHDWKVYTSFRFNEWHCSKCPATKEWSCYKDGA